MVFFTTTRFVRYNKNNISTLLSIRPNNFIFSRYYSTTNLADSKIIHSSELDHSSPYNDIPPVSRTNESIEQKRSRLLYQSRKRGILETDLLLSTFANKYLKTFTEQELKEYDELL